MQPRPKKTRMEQEEESSEDNTLNINDVLKGDEEEEEEEEEERRPGSHRRKQKRDTGILTEWLETHQSNPYPTKTEKQQLAAQSRMTLRQLNDWFANARRNIKKLGIAAWRKRKGIGSSAFADKHRNLIPPPNIIAAAKHPNYKGPATFPMPLTAYIPPLSQEMNQDILPPRQFFRTVPSKILSHHTTQTLTTPPTYCMVSTIPQLYHPPCNGTSSSWSSTAGGGSSFITDKPLLNLGYGPSPTSVVSLDPPSMAAGTWLPPHPPMGPASSSLLHFGGRESWS